MDDPLHLSANELRVVRRLLWTEITQQLNPAEQDEVKKRLDWALITENESLMSEADALAEILGEVQVKTNAILDRQKICTNPTRSLVETEVKVLVERLRELAGSTPFSGSGVKGRDPEAVIPRSNSKEQNVVEYVSSVAMISMSSLDTTLRPRTSSTRPSSARPTTSSTRISSRPSSSASSSCASAVQDPKMVVQAVQKELNVWDIDRIKEPLCRALKEENSALMEDVEYLQGMLIDESDFQVKAAMPAPSLEDLREYGHKLRAVVAAEEGRVEQELRVSRMFSVVEEEQGKARRLRGMVQVSREDIALGNGKLSPDQDSTPGQGSSLNSRTLNGAQSHLRSTSSGRSAARLAAGSILNSSASLASFKSGLRPSSSSDIASSLLPTSESAATAAPSRAEKDLLVRESSKHSSSLAPVGMSASCNAIRPKTDARLSSPQGFSDTASTYNMPSSSSRRPVNPVVNPVVNPGGSLQRPALQASPEKAAKLPPLSHDLAVRSRPAQLAPLNQSKVSLSGREPESRPAGSSSSSARQLSQDLTASSGSSMLLLGRDTPAKPRSTASAKRTGSLGGPINLVEELEAEVDSVLGGVASILAKHGLRPSSVEKPTKSK
ncbi:hypothetical protein CEUSTIGMA_g8965.t1 [Chlamydomonas eustigma]|uniref:Uncharacterized protein n=1 Tax=Chlamydomonas eustigma TaxID=1157962 RepID=A0A250XEP8_9CHLO|nr:hypothetical protein CEUSTIGMA_g8965.t1 [Chlamydomonas eustigma]|eukprot:GAX81537.1 hypothetical protein CEUSTIGMA_g8965.t1 [Chlamydomonas eustigma]